METNQLAPIALTVFNRPEHTKRTIEALSKNDLAGRSELYIYADGPRNDSDLEDVRKTREIIKKVEGFKKVTIVERESNWGLAKSVITAATELTKRCGKVIMLEDDLVTSKGFLRYMNEALEVYKNDEQVMHISGYMFPVKEKLPETFFYNTASTWGWATWYRSWKHFNNNIAELKQKLDESGRIGEFNIDDSNNFYNQVLANFDGRRKTWGIRWYATMFLLGGYALHPGKSLVQNIGNDGTGTNTGRQSEFWHHSLAEGVRVERIPIEQSRVALEAMKKYYQNIKRMKQQRGARRKIKDITKKITPNLILDMLIRPERFRENMQDRKLRNTPRFETIKVTFLGKEIIVPDAASYLFQKQEMFDKEIYKFKSSKQRPYILDCGVNSGLSTIYFKQLFPDAEIVAFEPDPKIYEMARSNLRVFGFEDVEVKNLGVWNEETELSFFAEGADGGKVTNEGSGEKLTTIKTTRLRDYLERQVDYLNIDIEGSETVVIQDCADRLHNVENLFIEYHSYIDSPQTLGEILQILSGAGMRYFIHSLGLRQKHPFLEVKVKSGMDGQVNIMAIKESK